MRLHARMQTKEHVGELEAQLVSSVAAIQESTVLCVDEEVRIGAQSRIQNKIGIGLCFGPDRLSTQHANCNIYYHIFLL